MFKLLIFLTIINILHIASADKLQLKINDHSVIAANTAADNVQQKLEVLSAANEALSARLKMLSKRLEQLPFAPQPSHANNNNASCITKYPSSCLEATAIKRKTGLYTIQLNANFNDYPQPFVVACDEDAMGGGWTVVQRRRDGSIDFYRTWAEYKMGFGNLDGEFWIGLDKLHALTTQTPQELLVIMEDFDNVKEYAWYTSFAIGSEHEAYAMNVLGNYSGDAGDSLRVHEAMKFSTKDVDNDNSNDNCAIKFTGAWWYNSCHHSNLNGQYLRGVYPENKYAQGVVWRAFRGNYYSLKYVQMLIRPQRV